MCMEKIGIVCEYNPFHNGHKYHIEQIKNMFPDSLIILIMSGYFTERGEISLISKYNKTKIALEYGIDVILELPSLYAVNSADYFADAAIKALSIAGVQKIVFGSETNDISLLKSTARKQLENPDFDSNVKSLMNTGVNYPTALSISSGSTFKSNDLLGVSYIKSIMRNNFDIEPITIQRTNDYNDLESNDDIISASNIREKYRNGLSIKKYIPLYSDTYINKVDENKLFELLKYKIITSNNLNDYLGVDEGLDNKLKSEIYNVQSVDGLLEKIKSKRYTYVRLRRMLMHILLGIRKIDMNCEFINPRILGFSKQGQKYLSELKSENLIFKDNSRIREIELRASDIYYMLTNDNSCKLERLNKPVK